LEHKRGLVRRGFGGSKNSKIRDSVDTHGCVSELIPQPTTFATPEAFVIELSSWNFDSGICLQIVLSKPVLLLIITLLLN